MFSRSERSVGLASRQAIAAIYEVREYAAARQPNELEHQYYRRISPRPGEAERQIATLPAGDVFGEMVRLTDEPRNATVQAVEETF